MVPGQLQVDATKTHVKPTEGSVSIKPPEESLPDRVPVFEGNASATDLISSQPVPVPLPVVAAVLVHKPQCDPQKPTCPKCASRHLRSPQGSSLSVHSGNSKRSKKRKSSAATLNQPASPGDSCFDLLLACLSCHCSVLLLGLLDLCSSGLLSLCSCCGEGCTRCCSAVQDVPMEELNCDTHCHSVLFHSCCEPIECLEFCLECCEICHRS